MSRQARCFRSRSIRLLVAFCSIMLGLASVPILGVAQSSRPVSQGSVRQRVASDSLQRAAERNSPRQRATATLRAADRVLVELGDPARARELLLKAINEDSTYPAPLFRLGVIAEANEEWDDAERWFGRYVALDGASAWSTRAHVEIQRVRAAREADSIAGGPQPRRYAERLRLAHQLLESGSPRGALAAAQDAAAIDPTRWEAFALASVSLVKEKDFAAALSFLDSAIAKGGPNDRLLAAKDTLTLFAPVDARLPNLTLAALGEGLTLAGSEAALGASPAESFPGIRGISFKTDQIATYYLTQNVVMLGSSLDLPIQATEAQLRHVFTPSNTISAAEIGAVLVRAVAMVLRPRGWTQDGEAVKLAGELTDLSSAVTFRSPHSSTVRVIIWRRPTGVIELVVLRAK